jgi:hypothetical protein
MAKDDIIKGLRYVGFCWPVPCPALWRELTANDVRGL